MQKIISRFKRKTSESKRRSGEGFDPHGKNPLFSYEAGGHKTIYPKGIQCRSISG
jgi:hypothetical protein